MNFDNEIFKKSFELDAESLIDFQNKVREHFNNPIDNCATYLSIAGKWCELRGLEVNEENLKKYTTAAWMYFMYQQGIKDGKLLVLGEIK